MGRGVADAAWVGSESRPFGRNGSLGDSGRGFRPQFYGSECGTRFAATNLHVFSLSSTKRFRKTPIG